MANFKYSLTQSLLNNENPVKKLEKLVALLDANAQKIDDDVYAAGPLDLAPILASITEPKAIQVVCAGDGVQIKFDGGAFSVKAYKSFQLEVSPNSVLPGLLDIELQAVGADQRIRMYAVGD